MTFALVLLAIQGVLGALDNLIHHELEARLPSRVSARYELTLHAAREAIYGILFLGLAWARWEGGWAWLVLALLLAEIVITLADFLEEDVSRRLPPFERVLHTVLAIGYGAFLAAFLPVLIDWAAAPTGIVAADHGLLSWLLTAYAIGVLAWSVRNALAVHHLRGMAAARPVIRTGTASSTVLVTGATGFIGTALVDDLLKDGARVIVLSRDARRAARSFVAPVIAIESLDLLPDETRIDAIVNLAGASIAGGLWTRRRRRVLIESRSRVAGELMRLMARLDRKPRVLVTASAIGYYGLRGDEPLDEEASPQAIFQSELCQLREAETMQARVHGVRPVMLRFGLVLGPSGGVLQPLAFATRLGLGSVMGSGAQIVSWIHLVDAVALIRFAIDRAELFGPVNAVAPETVPQRRFAEALAAAMRRPLWLHVPELLLRVGLGELSQLFLRGQNVVPRRALAAGFAFRYPTLSMALRDLVGRRVSGALTPDSSPAGRPRSL
jgi:uncharacterized protein (TIGR01777 family)